jgi:uncharacterized membrane protein
VSTSPSDSADDASEPDGIENSKDALVKRIQEKFPDATIRSEDVDEILHQIVQIEKQEFSGPIPSPQMLAEYERILPGLARDIVDRANREQEYRHEVGRSNVDARRSGIRHAATQIYLGQGFAFIIAMTAIGGGIWLIGSGYSAGGLTSIISALAALVVAFITGKWFESKEEDSSGGLP